MTREKVFSDIYKNKKWGRIGPSSGEGTRPSAVGPYLAFLIEFLQSHRNIKSILDVGHGDWKMWPENFFENYEYIGIDIVNSLSREMTLEHGSSSSTFIGGDYLEMQLPDADLLLIKDVLIHLSNAEIIESFSIFSKYKYILVTTDISSSGARVYLGCLKRMISSKKWNYLGKFGFNFVRVIRSELNSDIQTGSYHWVNLNEPTWNLNDFGLRILGETTYKVAGITFGRKVTKSIVLLESAKV